MVELIRPSRGGFFRPFGAGQFTKAFLGGHGPDYDAPKIDPKVGAPQSDIHAAYKGALHRAMAEDAAAWDAGEAIRKGKPMTQEEVEERRGYYLERIPYKLTKMRYQSFHTYFGHLKRLGWVEETKTGRPVVKVVKEIGDSVKMVRENFVAGLVAYANGVAMEMPEGYKAQVDLARQAGLPIVEHDRQELEQAFAKLIEAKLAEAKELVAVA